MLRLADDVMHLIVLRIVLENAVGLFVALLKHARRRAGQLSCLIEAAMRLMGFRITALL